MMDSHKISCPRQTPVHVSPVIRASRYLFLLAGIIYGMNKTKIYEAIEKREIVRREQRIHERIEREKAEGREKTKEFLIEMAETFQIELPPNWEPPE